MCGYYYDVSVENASFVTLKYSVAGELQWVVQNTGNNENDDEAIALCVDKSENVIVTGTSYNFEYEKIDVRTIKYNSSGNQIWMKIFNSATEYNDVVTDIATDTNGNVIICGTIEGNPQSFVINYKPNGTRYWINYDTTADELYSIAVDDSGNFYAGGNKYAQASTDIALIKYSPNGTKQWSTYYDSPNQNNDEVLKIAVEHSNKIHVLGATTLNSYGTYDIVNIKYNSDGTLYWDTIYAGEKISIDVLIASVMDNSGNLYVTGRDYNSSQTKDIITIKYSANDSIEWSMRYSSSGSKHDEPVAIVLDNGGNVFVTGKSNNDTADCVIIKYSTNGEQLWVKTFGGTSGKSDHPVGISVDNAGNAYVVANVINGANFNTDIVIVKYSPLGNEEWVKLYNGETDSTDKAIAFSMDNAGNIYIAGTTWMDANKYDYLTLKYDAQGNELWHRTYNSDTNYIDKAYGITSSSEGKVFVTGTTKEGSIRPTMRVLCYSANGTLEWVKDFSDSTYQIINAKSIMINTNGQIIITGAAIFTNYYLADALLVSCSQEGAILWQTVFKDIRIYNYYNPMIHDAHGNIYLSGTNLRGGTIIIAKFNATGIHQWNTNYAKGTNSTEEPRTTIIGNDNNVIYTGTSYLHTTEFTILKYEQTFTGVAEENEVQKFSLSQNYPNPFNPKTTIGFSLATTGNVTLKIYNTLGQKIATLLQNEKMDAGKHEVQFDGSTIASGIYFYRLSINEKLTAVKKLVIMK